MKLGTSREADIGLLRALCDDMAKVSGGRLRIAAGEQSDSTGPDKEAGDFLKFDGRRMARDIQVYVFMGKVQGWEPTVVDLATELVMKVKTELPEAFAVGIERLKQFGSDVMKPDKAAEWVEILSDIAAPAAPAP